MDYVSTWRQGLRQVAIADTDYMYADAVEQRSAQNTMRVAFMGSRTVVVGKFTFPWRVWCVPEKDP